jgi:hypothetical protein
MATSQSPRINADGAEGYHRPNPMVDLLSACCQVSMAYLFAQAFAIYPSENFAGRQQ